MIWLCDFVYYIQIAHVIAISTNINRRYVSFATNTAGRVLAK